MSNNRNNDRFVLVLDAETCTFNWHRMMQPPSENRRGDATSWLKQLQYMVGGSIEGVGGGEVCGLDSIAYINGDGVALSLRKNVRAPAALAMLYPELDFSEVTIFGNIVWCAMNTEGQDIGFTLQMTEEINKRIAENKYLE